jgi:hypothetical protein
MSEVHVAGRVVQRPFVGFERACLVTIKSEQAKVSPYNTLIDLLCDAMRPGAWSRRIRDRRLMGRFTVPVSPTIYKISFQLEFGPIPRLVWTRAFKLGYWRESRCAPIRYRRMMAFERCDPTAPYILATYPGPCNCQLLKGT